MAEQQQLRTNHNIRIVTLATGERVLCMFGDVREQEDTTKVVGYRMLYPYTLSLGTPNEDGSIPIHYERWCPFSPQEEHRMSGEHIISVVFPDNNILDNFTKRLNDLGITDDQIFIPEEEDGDNSEPAEAAE
tara:strand:+ start:641 stop:1036 length:396 start_codon:yes stop_codon:yes gene_type:complete